MISPARARSLAIALLVGTALDASITLWAWSTPWGDWGILLFAAIGWLVICMLWLVGTSMAALSRRRLPGREWLIAPAIVVLTLLAIRVNAPVWLRFEASRSAFDQFVNTPSAGGGQLGLFNGTDVERTDSRVRFQVSCAALLACSGFVYSPVGPPGPLTTVQADLEPDTTAYVHLDGPWYMWARRYT